MYHTLNSIKKISSKNDYLYVEDSSENSAGSIEKLNLKLLERTESVVPKKKYNSQYIKKIIGLAFINVSIMSSLMIISISLEDIGISNIVVSNIVLSSADFISNLIVYIFGHKMPRKKSLIILNIVMASLSSALLLISIFIGYTNTKFLNLMIALVMKATIVIMLVMSLLFGSKFERIILTPSGTFCHKKSKQSQWNFKFYKSNDLLFYELCLSI